ncbi:MAG TPA: 8-amino-7-oxononanoate synthase [Pirellulales bacterium]|jgi:8-amino-7-oxononanoate synthase|nr:8-amino-7-oxononanoate synthase [Pirellulales bacterium]
MPTASDNQLGWLDDELRQLDATGLRRRLVTRSGPQGPTVSLEADDGAALGSGGAELLNFSSNDYLALAGDPRLVAAAHTAALREGWGAGSSPLVTGHSRSHRDLELRLAEFLQTEGALVFPSGFAANSGTIAALVGRGDLVLGDQKNHASLIDGCRLSRAEVQVYPHRDMARLAEFLGESSRYRRRLIVTDTLFSMDGDLAPLADLVELARRHRAMLMVDEAHAIGVFGSNGRGVAEHFGLESELPIRVGTLSKALGSAGGFVAGSRRLIDWLCNRARSYVFSTAHPPAVAAAAIAALDIVRDEPQRRRALLERAASLRQSLREQGWNIGDAAGQIIPVVIGDAGATMQMAAALRDRGLFVPGIRPPTVPAGESLLRISLSRGHTAEMVERLANAISGSRATPPLPTSLRT